jgi:hypothetical protein
MTILTGAREGNGSEKKTGWTGPHPAGYKKGEKELKSQEGRVAYYHAVLTVLAHQCSKQISCHI